MDSARNSFQWGLRKGSIKIAVNNRRYMPCTDAGADDHFTKMEENDIAVMPISNGMNVGRGADVFLMDVPFN
ncbi:hypothetical protein J21TS7_17140 [Paenibacillus cineris]|uniref:Uncharacterized protein n=1 Tax=Paenibacillus cineris TaxID=237530 RepID=A0ABQ4L9Z1_9BACL|nr:hypothetical protein J21TS7_17140 [Paenibacillus cineris]